MADDTLEALDAVPSEQRATLEWAWRYWRVAANWRGCDIRSGGYVVHAFRAAALAGPEGAAAFARAYEELFAVSGEGPRLAYVDGELRRALSRARASLSGEDARRVRWVLECVGG